MYLLMSSNHPYANKKLITLDNLEQQELILDDYYEDIDGSIIDQTKKKGIAVRLINSPIDSSSLLKLEQGGSMILLAESYLAPYIYGRTAIPLENCQREFVIMRRKDASAKVIQFVDRFVALTKEFVSQNRRK